MPDDAPFFSVLMANYNNGRYIAEAIESVIRQTFTDWELIIVDDCSTDNSVKIISQYLKDNRIKFYQNKYNIGYIRTLRKMIKYSQAEILGILDSDDALLPNAIAEMVKVYTKHERYGFVYSQYVRCDENLNELKVGLCRQKPDNKSEIQEHFVDHFKTFRKKCYYQTSGYDEEILYAEDRDIILKLEEVTKFYFVNKVLYKYRIRPGSHTIDSYKSLVGRTSVALAKYKAFLRRKDLKTPNLTKKQMSNILFAEVIFCLKSKQFKRAWYFFINSLRLYPFNFKAYFFFLCRIIKFPFYRLVKFCYLQVRKYGKSNNEQIEILAK